MLRGAIALLILLPLASPTLSAVQGFTMEAEGLLTHHVFVDDVLACASVGPFRASTGFSPTGAIDGERAGSFLGVTECGSFAHGFDACTAPSDIIPQSCWRGSWNTLEIDLHGHLLKVSYERTLPDGTRDVVRGDAVWGV